MLSRGAASAAAVNQSLPFARRRRLQHVVRKWSKSISTAQARGAKTQPVLCSMMPTSITVLPPGAPRSSYWWGNPMFSILTGGDCCEDVSIRRVSRGGAGEDARGSLRAAGGEAVSSRMRCIARPPFESLEATVVHTLPLRPRRPSGRSCARDETQTSDRATRTAFSFLTARHQRWRAAPSAAWRGWAAHFWLARESASTADRRSRKYRGVRHRQVFAPKK